MDAPQLASSPSSRPEPSSLSWTPWFFVSVIFTVAIALAAAHAPPRIRLIGLFSIAFGLLVGWVLRELSIKLDAGLSKYWIGLGAALFTVGGLVGSTCEIVRLEVAMNSNSPNDAIALRMIEQMQQPAGDVASMKSTPSQIEELRRHLASRIRQLATWSSPWPEAFWILELVAAATASSWMASRTGTRTIAISND